MLQPLITDTDLFDAPEPIKIDHIEVKEVPAGDPRGGLAGQRGVYAAKTIPAWTIVGECSLTITLQVVPTRADSVRVVLGVTFQGNMQAR